MVDARWVLAVLALMTPWLVVDAAAQGSEPEYQFFVNVDGGYQSGSSTFSDGTTFTQYGESGSTDVQYDTDRAGGLFNLSGGMMLWRNIGFAVGYSRSEATSTAAVTVTSPHPIFFNRPRTAMEMVDTTHTSNMVHFMAVATFPLSEKIELAVTGGPSRLEVEQTQVVGVTPIDVASPFDTVDRVLINSDAVRKIGAGFNIGADLTYKLHRNYGVGFFARYAGGSLDFPVLDNLLASYDVGGFQIGGGVRLRF